MSRIGFVDNKLENFHANVFLRAFRETLQSHGVQVAGCFALDAANGKAWAAKNNVRYCESIDDLEAHVDAYMILAPSNPELHLQLAERVFPFGKPTYVDKTFAPDLATAKKIFALADQYETPIQSSSALRYTNVQDHIYRSQCGPIQHMITWGGGSSFAEYAIHPIELLVSVMGPKVTSMMCRTAGEFAQLLINFTGDRTGVVNVYTQGETPFAASITTPTETRLIPVEVDQIFVNNAAAILEFFESGIPGIDSRETLAIRKILDTAQSPAARDGFIPL